MREDEATTPFTVTGSTTATTAPRAMAAPVSVDTVPARCAP